MKEAYKDIRFKSASLKMIHIINSILDDYEKQGFVLTVRQLYYQLVARDYIPNNEKSYKSICNLVNDGRLAGLIDWNMIEDRTRSFIKRSAWDSPSSLLDACARQFHMSMWETQPCRVFVIVEKEALVGVLERVCNTHDVPLLAARGYPSASVIRGFAEEDLLPALAEEKECAILHFGDHDPSGIDMTRDLKERLHMFCGYSHNSFQLVRMALNMDQINELKPPPNPAKMTDSRFGDYRRRFGNQSWELDALPPSYLEQLAETKIRTFIEWEEWNKRKELIAEGKELILDASAFMQDRNQS